MAEPHLFAIDAAGLLVTDACPARCRHCYLACGPEGRAWMTPEDARGHFEALRRLGVRAQGLHVGGGEPMADFDRLLAILEAAREAGYAGVAWVETSGFWATDEERVRGRLLALRDAGMAQVSISADPYHQEFVPPERPRLLYDVAREALGPGGVRARRWRWLKGPEDVAALGEGARRALFAGFLARYPERMTGRAARQLAPLVPRAPMEAIEEAPCRQPMLEGRHVHVDPSGWVVPGTCAGLALGRATGEAPLDEVLAGWRLKDHLVAQALAEGGPRRLARAAAERGFVPDPAGYAGACHLCWSVRAHLSAEGLGGDELEPRTLYTSEAVHHEAEARPR